MLDMTNPRIRYIATIALDHEDFESHEFKTLTDAKAFCEKNEGRDFFTMPRVYVEELALYAEDDLHISATAWESVAFHEYDTGEWVKYDTPY